MIDQRPRDQLTWSRTSRDRDRDHIGLETM